MLLTLSSPNNKEANTQMFQWKGSSAGGRKAERGKDLFMVPFFKMTASKCKSLSRFHSYVVQYEWFSSQRTASRSRIYANEGPIYESSYHTNGIVTRLNPVTVTRLRPGYCDPFKTRLLWPVWDPFKTRLLWPVQDPFKTRICRYIKKRLDSVKSSSPLLALTFLVDISF